jgi:hypothetical protein
MSGASLILERACMPMAHFFPWGHTKNGCTVPPWHTKNSDYFCHSNLHSLEKTYFGHLLIIKNLQNICACMRGGAFCYIYNKSTGPFYARHTDCLGAQ